MILDELTEFCDATAMNTGGAGSYLLGDVIDLGSIGTLKNIGNGAPVYFVLQVVTTATSGGAATGDFQLVTDSVVTLLTSQTIHWQSGALALATIAAGLQYVIPLPVNKTYERYMGVLQVTAVVAFTAGAINAFLTLDPAGWYATPDATN